MESNEIGIIDFLPISLHANADVLFVFLFSFGFFLGGEVLVHSYF